MKVYTYTLEQFTAATCLLPRVIATRVADDHRLPLDRVDAFVEWVEQQCVRCFNRHRRFRRATLAQNPLPYIYMIVEHWLDAWVKRTTRGEQL